MAKKRMKRTQEKAEARLVSQIRRKIRAKGGTSAVGTAGAFLDTEGRFRGTRTADIMRENFPVAFAQEREAERARAKKKKKKS